MPVPLLGVSGISTPGRGPGGTSRVFFWVRSDRQHPSAPDIYNVSGSDVTTWKDQSFYDHHLFSDPGQRPELFIDNIVCGPQVNNSVHFTQSEDDFMETQLFEETYLDMLAQKQLAVHIAFKANDQNDNTLFALPGLGTEPRDGFSVSLINGGVEGRISLGLDCGGGEYVPTIFTLPGVLNYGDGNVHTVSFMYNQSLPSGNLKMFCDGVLVSISLNTNGIFADSRRITLGTYPGISSLQFGGYILEVIAQTTANNGERGIIYDYFQRKWCSS